MKTIKTKVERVLLLVALVPLLLLGAYVYVATSQTLTASSEENLHRQVELLGGSMAGVLKHVPGDLRYLRDSASMFQYGRALVIKDQNVLDVNGRAMARDFLSMVRNRGIYSQIRFIGADGKELIRVEHNEDEGFSRILQPEQLRDKRNSPYFKATSKLGMGEVYVSSVDLNQENGRKDAAKFPTIRFASPVYAVGDRLVGVLMLSVDANQFLRQVTRESDASAVNFMMVDDQGFFIAHQDESLLWGSDQNLAHGRGLANMYADMAEPVTTATQATMFSVSDSIVATQPVVTADDLRAPLGRLIAVAPKSEVLKLVNQFLIALAVFIVVALVAVFFVAKKLSGSLTSPLIKLTKVAEELSRGEVDTPIEIKSNDEVQRLAEAFERLRTSLKILMRLD